LLKKDRTTVPVEIFSISATGLSESENQNSDGFMGTQGVARDITNRKKAEAEREKIIPQRNAASVVNPQAPFDFAQGPGDLSLCTGR